MTLHPIHTPQPDFQRDRYGRPKVIPMGKTRPVSYRRVTTFVGVLEDKYKLELWGKRMVAQGLADRPDLILSVQAHRDDKRKLDQVAAQALDAAAASAAATTGTALHAFTDMLDRGQPLPALPEHTMASLRAFQDATKQFTVKAIEQRLANDHLKVAGTCDRIYEHNGELFIADTKSGSIEFGVLKMAMQLAVYAHSNTYDPSNDTHGEHGCNREKGIIMHTPAVTNPADARCDVYWIDLNQGKQAAHTAKRVWDYRGIKPGDLLTPVGTIPAPEPDPVTQTRERLARSIKKTIDPRDIRQMWASNADVWTPELTELAKQRVAVIESRKQTVTG